MSQIISNKLFLLLGLFIFSTTLQAQVFCDGTPDCSSRGFGFNQGITQNVLPQILREGAYGATLNAIRAIPTKLEMPETFAIGYNLQAAGGSIRQKYSDDKAYFNKGSNVSNENWPVAFQAYGGTLASNLYAFIPAEIFSLPDTHLIGVHLAYHGHVYEGKKSIDLANIVQSSNPSRVSFRQEAIGFRYSVPVSKARGWQYLQWKGLRFRTGMTYAFNSSQYRSEYKQHDYMNPSQIITEPSSDFINSYVLANKTIEYQTRFNMDSRNLVLPLELETGIRFLFISFDLTPGVAINYGKHKGEINLEGTSCISILDSCSKMAGYNLLIKSEIDALLSPFVNVNDLDIGSFYAHNRESFQTRTFIPYLSLDTRFHFTYLELVLSTLASHETAQVGISVELNF